MGAGEKQFSKIAKRQQAALAVELPGSLLAVPTIIRLSPLPERRVIGNLSSYQRALEGLGLHQIGDWDVSDDRNG